MIHGLNYHVFYYLGGTSKLVSFETQEERTAWVGHQALVSLTDANEFSIVLVFDGVVKIVNPDEIKGYDPTQKVLLGDPTVDLHPENDSEELTDRDLEFAARKKSRVAEILNKRRGPQFETNAANHSCDNQDCRGYDPTK